MAESTALTIMSEAEAKKHTDLAFAPTKENIDLLKTTLGNGNLTDAELQLTIYQANKAGLDPLARQIYPMKLQGKLTFVTAIDGYRLIAERTGKYRGQTTPMFCGKDGIWKEVWLEDTSPAAAKVGVMREGFPDPVYAIALWKAYGKTSGVWNTMPDVMLAKCAEALALRKAFPQELSTVYTQEELDQAERDGSAPAGPAPAAEPKKMTVPEVAAECGKIMHAAGIVDADERKQVVCNIAEVKSVKDMKGAEWMKVRKYLIDNKPDEATLRTFLPIEAEEAEVAEEVIVEDEGVDEVPA